MDWQPRMKEVDEEERGDDHCTRNDTTFNESVLRPLVERHSKRPPGQATTPPLQTQLGAKAPDKPMSTFEKMVMFFEKTETAPHKGPKPHPIPRPEEPCGSVHHERWRNFACQERSEQKGCTLTTHDLTVLTEQPIPQNTTTKTQGKLQCGLLISCCYVKQGIVYPLTRLMDITLLGTRG